MTIKDAKQKLSEVGFTLKHDTKRDYYIVDTKTQGTFYTPNLQDAVDTGLKIATGEREIGFARLPLGRDGE